MKKDTFYFTHDYSARSDDKIKELIFEHGMLGYGIFWAIVEDLYQNTNVLRLNYERISAELKCGIKIVESVINDFDLFVINNNTFSSNSVQTRLLERQEKSIKATKSVQVRWEKEKSNTNVIRDETICNTIKEKKLKEIKEKEVINNNIDTKIFKKPAINEISDYITENNYKVNANKFYDFYESKGWLVGKNKMKDWKAAVRTWNNSDNQNGHFKTNGIPEKPIDNYGGRGMERLI